MSDTTVTRIGDMHPTRALAVTQQRSMDVVVRITQDGCEIGESDFGNERARSATIEYCVSGGRSPHTLNALLALMEAIKLDNEERPIELQIRMPTTEPSCSFCLRPQSAVKMLVSNHGLCVCDGCAIYHIGLMFEHEQRWTMWEMYHHCPATKIEGIPEWLSHVLDFVRPMPTTP